MDRYGRGSIPVARARIRLEKPNQQDKDYGYRCTHQQQQLAPFQTKLWERATRPLVRRQVAIRPVFCRMLICHGSQTPRVAAKFRGQNDLRMARHDQEPGGR